MCAAVGHDELEIIQSTQGFEGRYSTFQNIHPFFPNSTGQAGLVL